MTAALEIQRVEFDINLEKSVFTHYDLSKVDRYYANGGSPATAAFQRHPLHSIIIHDGNYSTVYGWSLLAPDGSKTNDVVIKLGEMKRIWREAQLYDRLKLLQGHRVIPNMFGFWVAEREPDDSNPWAFLILERFGACLNVPFSVHWKVCNAVLFWFRRNLHNVDRLFSSITVEMAFIMKVSFHPGNVLQKGNEFRVIDLDGLISSRLYSSAMWTLRPSQVDKRDISHITSGWQNTGWPRTPNFPSKKMMNAPVPRCILGRFDGADAKDFLTQYYERLYSKMKELGLETANSLCID
ncbi:hypothetical protein BT96DRAFT_921534 [Gymnopus androsaceus JB14]|uniref:Protein kinase domain-containing protein n=1 Tax=Gymnopus androsaceus JB14 TaxID=1447944 RepID=A0A6A4HFU4_9AGAR|nr:hypothetical protein BT96DRAFT_921534 [Gymnopus androsaceus JB14]